MSNSSEESSCLSTTDANIANLCSTYLKEPWGSADQNDINIERFSNGYANRTYRCKYIGNEPLGDAPSDVLIHLYGSELHGEDAPNKKNGEAAEAVIVSILGRFGMAPALYGVFPGGRIEEYIPNTLLTNEGVKDRPLFLLIARKLAKFHSLNMPVPKAPNNLENVKTLLRSFREKYNVQPDTSLVDDLEEEKQLDWFDRALRKISGKPVFMHGDLNSNNILIVQGKESTERDVMLIDYEQTGYYYRGYDIAFFFSMKRCTVDHENGGIKIEKVSVQPDTTMKANFLEEYLTETRVMNGGKLCPLHDTLDNLTMEVEFSDVFQLLWIVLWTRTLPEEVYCDSKVYAEVLFKEYQHKKTMLFEKYGDPCSRPDKVCPCST